MFQIQRILIFTFLLALSQAQLLEVEDRSRRNNDDEKLQILVLYETLCRDSINFMATQLGKVHDELKDLINVKLVPFGKSHSENNGANFYCQHGPEECGGNRKHSCVLSQTQDQTARVNFAVCAMSQPPQYFEDCVELVGLNPNIERCMSTQEGTKLQLKAEKITERYRPTFVPTIIYDEVFDQKLQDRSIHNFRRVVCSQLKRRGLLDSNEPRGLCK